MRAMSWYELLLFVHVAAAAIWLGGGFIFQIYGMVVLRGGDPKQIAYFAGNAGRIGERLFTPASIIVVLAGVGLMIEGSWDWGQLWVVFALAAFAASFVVGVGYLGPTAKKLEVVGPETPEGQRLIRQVFAVLRADLTLLYAIVFAMTVKPTSDDLWTVVVAGAAVVVLTAVFLRGMRAPRLESAAVGDPA